MNLLVEQIKKMDKKSDEFFEVYVAACEKYWDFDEEDDETRARTVLHLITEKGEFEEVALLVALYQQIMQITEKKTKTVAGEIGFKDLHFFFRISTEKDGFDKMQKLLSNTVIVKAREEAPPKAQED